MFDNNIKVHFAGAEGGESTYAALQAAKTHYCLYSCYSYIANKTPDADFRLPENNIIRAFDIANRQVIQDSGLYTMMFGAGKGKKQTRESLTQWQNKLIAFVQQNGIQATCVEIDCQKVLGVEDAWFFRERMKRLLKNRQINVFHFEDGRKGLDRLIEFSDYIAVSVPEWRIVKKGSHRKDIRYITHYIKNKKPEIDIHLLGCTDFKILAENSFCTSADSTSWLFGIMYGHFRDGTRDVHIKNFKQPIVQERMEKVKAILESRGAEITPKTLEYTTNSSICATICKDRYALVAGPQD